MQIIKQPVLPTLNDPWISGFTDAEGCFNVKVEKRENTVTGFRVILRFILDQKHAEALLLHIQNIFGFGSVASRKSKDLINPVYRYTNNSIKGLISVQNYFLAYPLKSKKYKSFTK